MQMTPDVKVCGLLTANVVEKWNLLGVIRQDDGEARRADTVVKANGACGITTCFCSTVSPRSRRLTDLTEHAVLADAGFI